MNVLQILDTAIQREINAQSFYEEAAAFATSASGKQMLSWLAGEELQHKSKLEKEREAVVAQGKWRSRRSQPKSGAKSKPSASSEFRSPSEAIGEATADAAELGILQRAIKAEEESVSFYDKAAEATADLNGQAMLRRLSEIERGHLELLQEEYDWLSRSKARSTIHRFSLPSGN